MDNLFVFTGWNIAKDMNGKVVTYVEISSKEFFNMIDEFKIHAKQIGKEIKIEKIEDDNFVYVNYVLDEYLIGFGCFVLFEDFIEVI